jgi:hypothetical protein
MTGVMQPHQAQEELMTEVKSEITLKFNELPQAQPAANKKVEISLTDQNGVTFTALINAKSWRKAETDATTFSDWGGAVSGKLGQPTDKGFEVVDAGIKVFEKKAKEPKPEDTTIKADVAPIV